jgi:hypothetical protein
LICVLTLFWGLLFTLVNAGLDARRLCGEA